MSKFIMFVKIVVWAFLVCFNATARFLTRITKCLILYKLFSDVPGRSSENRYAKSWFLAVVT